MQNWGRAPHLMLEKCALANAVRLAFPNIMTGMYTAEEIDPNAEAKPLEARNVTPQLEAGTDEGRDMVAALEERARLDPDAPDSIALPQTEIYTGKADQQKRVIAYLERAKVPTEAHDALHDRLMNQPLTQASLINLVGNWRKEQRSARQRAIDNAVEDLHA